MPKYCVNYVGLRCVDGNCPNALKDDGEPNIKCEDCWYNEQCKDCALANTPLCENIKKL